MITIRKQTPKDARQVKYIKSIVTHELRSIYRPINTENLKDKTAAIHLLATLNDKVVGTAEYLLYKDNALVQGLAILPEYRNRGIATKIIDYITLKVKAEGKHELLLSTVKETGNTELFLKMGFTAHSEEISNAYKTPLGNKVTIITLKKILNNL